MELPPQDFQANIVDYYEKWVFHVCVFNCPYTTIISG